jgi:hypothetical protein
MLTRTSIIALVAVAGLGATALVPTSAAARGGGFGHGGGFSHGPSMHRAVSHGPIVHRSVARMPIKSGLHKVSIKPGLKPGLQFAKHWPHKHPHWCHHHNCGPWYVGWHTPHYVVDVVEPQTAVIERVAAPLTSPIQRTDTCNCLTKQYLPDGSVLFADVCTKEEAMATPEELKAQAQGATPRVIPR